MGIQTTVGLFSGIDYGTIVDQLMEINAIPRDNLETRTKALTDEQYAVTELSALLLSVQYITNNLGKTELFENKSVASSQPQLLSASVTGKPIEGTYRFTPLQTAQQHQLLTSGVKSATESLGGGTMSFRFGAHAERAVSLDLLNGGEGIDRGNIRITDRSGSSAEIDLSTAQTIDDVLEAINGSTQINMTAEANGDRIRLVDHTGQTTSNLKVQEIGGGTTADSLGLAGIDVADAVADGADVIGLSRGLELDFLNDGNGVTRDRALPDILYTLRDGTTGSIDLTPIDTGTADTQDEKTLGDVLDRINAEAPDKLRVEISGDGERLVIRDLTTGEGTFKIESFAGMAAEELGIAGESADGEISGRRLLGGLKSVLVSTLGGTDGLGELGSLVLTDRSGATDTVSLAGAETLEDVIEAINGANVGITASVNAAKNGIQLTDTTGASASNLIVASGDTSATAEKLGIAVDEAVDSHNSGDLHQKVVSHNTKLADLNGGAGVRQGKIRITDSAGASSTLEIDSDVKTIGDLIREINRLGANVHAEINETGDGIRIRDLAGGEGTLSVTESNSTTAADLHILGTATTKEIEGEDVQVIDGSTTYKITLDEDESLQDLIGRINKLGGGVQAMSFVDGSRSPYRMSLTSSTSGSGGAMVVDMSGLGFTLSETAEARDAILVLGGAESAASGIMMTSKNNTFSNVIDGVKLTINEASTSAVTVSVTTSSTNLTANVQTFVDNYNRLRESLTKYTAYDVDNDKRSVLTGDATALRLETDLADLISGRIFGAGSIQSLGEIGIDVATDGTLTFDSTVLAERFATDREAVAKFFTAKDAGFSARFKSLADQLAGEKSSLLTNRYLALGQKIEKNEEKIKWMDERLEVQRERLQTQFYQMELAISKMQANADYLSSIKYIGASDSSDDD
ncbi:MAG: flagellar filament capping protein FliD [Planctomycetaceae bacterium]|nr:flagellar filament capping protein FliD [Planctomycetaceae bacterium]